MKKILAILLAVFLAAGMIPACADSADDPDEWEGSPEESGEFVYWEQGNSDLKNVPFRLVNIKGKEPAVDTDSEWKLILKPKWEDQDMPDRITAVMIRLDCYNMDWQGTWSHVWSTELKDLTGLPETLPCIGPKIAGKYMLSVDVYHDDTTDYMYTYFSIDGIGKERITDVITAAAAENKVPGDEWQTALNLYRWLLDRQEYDYTFSFYSSDAVLRGAGVCDSYARLYYLLCKAAGLEAFVIYGNTLRGYHAWDAVKIDGEWYYADPTWDDHPANDPAMDYSQPAADDSGIPYGVSEYEYFMLNRELMTRNNHVTYEWLDDKKWTCAEQPATSLDANYYVHTGRCEQWGSGEGENFRTFREMACDALAAGEKLWSSRGFKGAVTARGFSDAPFRMTGTEYQLLAWCLKGSSVEMPDGSTVTLDTYCYEAPDMSGWVLNVFPEGARETDEPEKIELPEDQTEIEAHAYEGNRNVGEVVCPPGLESIGSRAFADCEGLWCIHIPSDIKEIAEDAFEGCGDFCIWTERRDSLPEEYAAQHDIPLFIYDEEKDSNG